MSAVPNILVCDLPRYQPGLFIGADFATKADRLGIFVARPMQDCGFKGDLFIEEFAFDDKARELVAPQITEGLR